MPCIPLSPKPHSPPASAKQTSLSYLGRSSAISMVSLGSHVEADSQKVQEVKGPDKPPVLSTDPKPGQPKG